MSGDVITLIFLAVGLLLVAFELFVPGLVVVFAGLGAIAVAILRYVGVVEGLPASFITWMVSSVVMVLALRGTLRRWFPPEESRHVDNEDLDLFGKVVDVLEEVSEATPGVEPSGRVRFGGTTWPAATAEGTIPKGAKARLVYRDSLAWIVEPAPQLEDGLDEGGARDVVPAGSAREGRGA